MYGVECVGCLVGEDGVYCGVGGVGGVKFGFVGFGGYLGIRIELYVVFSWCIVEYVIDMGGIVYV